MHWTHSCGSLVKQFPISNEPGSTLESIVESRTQRGPTEQLRVGGPGGRAGGCGWTGRARAGYINIVTIKTYGVINLGNKPQTDENRAKHVSQFCASKQNRNV